MRKPVTLITGANGEIGQGLIEYLGRSGHNAGRQLVALDLKPIDPELARFCVAHIVGDILDENLFNRLVSEFEIHSIFHLAALLSTRAEYSPDTAHKVNVNGTLNLLQLAAEQSRWHGHTIPFLFPSSIAVYGLPDLKTKETAPPVREHNWNIPMTMYGCNKLYCEQIGRYYSLHYRQLASQRQPSGVDFRALRFPGLISAKTVPTGGTSDYAPEMIHHAAKNVPYSCFVASSARIPFMVMPDAITALVELAKAPVDTLSQRVYNVSAFAPSAGEFKDRILADFPNAEIDFDPDRARATIVDSWPQRVDDSAARRDWGWSPAYDLDEAFDTYLVPGITELHR